MAEEEGGGFLIDSPILKKIKIFKVIEIIKLSFSTDMYIKD